ncbi:MAG: hypothetical protein ABW110_04545 [Steroidobacteraceae bacterium]
MSRRKYRRRPDQGVTAIKLDLDIDGFTYRKWGGDQRAKRGDWLIDNDGDIYTVDSESFARTYERLDKGRYVKTTPIWAEVASGPGRIPTKEGETEYARGDYIVCNEPDGGDAYAIKAADFERMYEEVES